MRRLMLLGAVVSFAVVLLACRSEDSDDNRSTDPATFARLIGGGVDFDYAPLQSPRDAVEQADAVVVGTIRGASEARIWTSTELRGGRHRPSFRYAILDFEVSRLVAGSLGQQEAGARINVELLLDHSPSWNDIERALPQGQVLLILYDDTERVAAADTEGFPEQVYSPSPDGVWFATEDGFEGVWAKKQELETRWEDQFPTLDALVSVLETAGER